MCLHLPNSFHEHKGVTSATLLLKISSDVHRYKFDTYFFALFLYPYLQRLYFICPRNKIVMFYLNMFIMDC